MAQLEDITASIAPIDNYVSPVDWLAGWNTNPLSPVLDYYTLMYPSGAVVTNTLQGVLVSLQTQTGRLDVDFLPDRPMSEWENATPMMGTGLVRLIEEHSVGGRRIVEYSMQPQDAPQKVVVSMPDVQTGSAAYWTFDQTAWFIVGMHLTLLATTCSGAA
jgi:hypothetical protein